MTKKGVWQMLKKRVLCVVTVIAIIMGSRIGLQAFPTYASECGVMTENGSIDTQTMQEESLEKS